MKKIICLIGPSGSGKTSLIRAVKDKMQFGEIISATTRKPRKGEKNGTDYWFCTKNEFAEEKKIECDSYSGAYCGTTASAVRYAMDGRFGAFAAVTYAGYKALAEYFRGEYSVLSVFADVPEKLLKERMKRRGDSPEKIAERLTNVREEDEYKNRSRCDCVFENTDASEESAEKFLQTVCEMCIMDTLKRNTELQKGS